MKNLIKKLKKDKQKFDKAKEQVQEYKKDYLHYKQLFDLDITTSEKERANLDKIKQKIEAAELAVKEKGIEIDLKLEQLDNFAGNTTRVKGYKGKSKFSIKDKKGATKKFADKGKVTISENMEVVVLQQLSEDLMFKEIIFWEEDQYYRGYLELGALTETNEDDKVSNKNILKAFLNDVEHALFRANSRILEMEKMYDEYFSKKAIAEMQQKTKGFTELNKSIAEDVKLIKDKEIKLDQKILSKIQKAQNKLLQIQEENIGKAILRVEENLTNSYNPKQLSGKTLKDVLTVIPLTRQWFVLSAPSFLSTTFDTYLKSSGITWEGSSGEILLQDDEKRKKMIATIVILKQNMDKIPDGSEKEWLSSISISKLKGATGFVVLQDGGINYDLSALFASGIATLQQFATLKIIPLQTIITHEINVSEVDITTGDDTHLTAEQAKEAQQNVSNNKDIDLDQLQMKDPEKIDDLYQSESYLELINIKYVLEKIKELQ